jgi:hypothetical protein
VFGNSKVSSDLSRRKARYIAWNGVMKTIWTQEAYFFLKMMLTSAVSVSAQWQIIVHRVRMQNMGTEKER